MSFQVEAMARGLKIDELLLYCHAEMSDGRSWPVAHRRFRGKIVLLVRSFFSLLC